MRELISTILRDAIERARVAGKLVSAPGPILIEAPKDPAHGDIASNVALTMARAESKPPRAIAEAIRSSVELPPEIEQVTVAGAGFINFRMAPAYWQSELRRAEKEGKQFWRPRRWPLPRPGNKVQVEFLSANPTGPVTVGHGRNAVLGDTIARLCEAAGFDVTREYYFNDGGRQMKLLGESVRVRY
ncbi:MAG TPA: arginine--tRNA ligase, partial [Candidatus Binataceae bacterium]